MGTNAWLTLTAVMDINDRPYRVIANIETNVRKWTVFEKDPFEAMPFRELWGKASKVGADAVVNARYTETPFGSPTWGRRKASGRAVNFLSDAGINLRAAQGKPF